MQPLSIQVQHLDARYTVARGCEDSSSIQRRLDHIAGNLLSRALENHFAALSAGDATLYFIEQMSVSLSINLDDSDEVMAKMWAQAVQEGILRDLGRGGGIITFRDRGEYLASFVESLLRGCAWDQWYYREFEPLRPLSSGQAILQVLLEDRDEGRDALIELTRRGDLDLLLATLTDSEVTAVAFGCLLPPSPRLVLEGAYARWTEAVRSILQAQSGLTFMIARDLARLYLLLLRERPDLGPDVNLARFIRDLLELRQAVMGVSDHRNFLAMLASGHCAEASKQLARTEERQFLAMLASRIGMPEVVNLLGDLQAASPQTITRRVSTRYGGLFLLAPAIVEMGLKDFLQGSAYREPSDASKSSLLLFIIGLQCLGLRNARQAQQDAGLCLFAGLAAAPRLSYLRQYAETLTADMHEAFVASFRSHQSRASTHPAGFRGSSEIAYGSKWFSLWVEDEPVLPSREWDAALAEVSQVVLRGLASKLGAFADSSPKYISHNFLESQAEVIVFEESIEVHFLTCPLQMVLRMAGFDHTTWILPWLEGRRLKFHFD